MAGSNEHINVDGLRAHIFERMRQDRRARNERFGVLLLGILVIVGLVAVLLMWPGWNATTNPEPVLPKSSGIYYTPDTTSARPTEYRADSIENNGIDTMDRFEDTEVVTPVPESTSDLPTIKLSIAGEKRTYQRLVFRLDDRKPDLTYKIELGDGKIRRFNPSGEAKHSYDQPGQYDVRIVGYKDGTAASTLLRSIKISS